MSIQPGKTDVHEFALTDDRQSLPAHMLTFREIPTSRGVNRYTRCSAMRSDQYLCVPFHKHITRAFELPASESQREGS